MIHSHSNSSKDLVKVLMEVGVKDPADRELSQMFPTDHQNTSGFTKSVWFLSLQSDHTHQPGVDQLTAQPLSYIWPQVR